MELAALFLIFGGSLLGLIMSGASASAEGGDISVEEDGFVTGTAGDDVITVTEDELSTNVEAGAGDDTIADLDSTTDVGIYDGGSGDDFIAVTPDTGFISGGAGDDTIGLIATGLVGVEGGRATISSRRSRKASSSGARATIRSVTV